MLALSTKKQNQSQLCRCFTMSFEPAPGRWVPCFAFLASSECNKEACIPCEDVRLPSQKCSVKTYIRTTYTSGLAYLICNQIIAQFIMLIKHRTTLFGTTSVLFLFFQLKVKLIQLGCTYFARSVCKRILC